MQRIDTTLGYADLKKQYEHICDCLTKDKKFEELIFFKLGVELMARQSELAEITFKQVDLENLKVYDLIDSKTNKVYASINISEELGELIKKHMNEDDDEKLFKKSLLHYKKSIEKSIGDKSFSIHAMRHMGDVFKDAKGEDILFKYRKELMNLNFKIAYVSRSEWIVIRTDYQNYSDPIKKFNTPEEVEKYIVSQIEAEKLDK